MKNYIEREAALIALGRFRQGFKHMEAKCVVDGCMTELTLIRPADVVERKRGRWIEVEWQFGDVYYDCSVCGESFCLIEGTPTDNIYNFCPSCGADMREVDHEP